MDLCYLKICKAIKEGYYKGWKIRPIYTKKVKYINRVPKEKIMVYNPDFFKNINEYQKFWLMEWTMRSRLIKDALVCDTMTKRLYLGKGYDINHIFKLYANTRFCDRYSKDIRYNNLLNGQINKLQSAEVKSNAMYYTLTDFYKWIVRTFTPGP